MTESNFYIINYLYNSKFDQKLMIKLLLDNYKQ